MSKVASKPPDKGFTFSLYPMLTFVPRLSVNSLQNEKHNKARKSQLLVGVAMLLFLFGLAY
ncbi:MAG: hypothetical protein D6735_15185 [Acidobacteria bacterium]|nr:MAG: hypothetical protein D6735_15185 [Acidobacteriota bacterium]